MVRRELADVLTAYFMGWKNVRDCAEWLSGIDWDADLDPQIQKVAACMELLTTEVLEGLRPEADFWQEAAKFLASESGSLYPQPLSMWSLTVADSSTDTSNPTVEITAGPTLVAKESPSWSISPQEVPG